jgi:hypothetical protein
MLRLSAPKEILVEGGHLSRGELACLCAAMAFPSIRLRVLHWSESGSPEPVLPTSTIHAVSLAEYYHTFAELLTSRYMFVVPCTQRGIIMANAQRRNSPVLSEPWLVEMTNFDKRFLRARYSAVASHFTKTAECWSEAQRPLLAKPLGGHSSSGQTLVTSEDDFERLRTSGDYLFEEWFGDSRTQYSCSVFKGGAWACIERVTQSGGHTAVARLPRDPEALHFCQGLRANVDVDAAINFQFAEVDGLFKIYDINPRFGYSELFRTCWGMNFVSVYFGLPTYRLTDKDELTCEAAWSLLRSSAIAASSRHWK